jgi:hypothetical protein
MLAAAASDVARNIGSAFQPRGIVCVARPAAACGHGGAQRSGQPLREVARLVNLTAGIGVRLPKLRRIALASVFEPSLTHGRGTADQARAVRLSISAYRAKARLPKLATRCRIPCVCRSRLSRLAHTEVSLAADLLRIREEFACGVYSRAILQKKMPPVPYLVCRSSHPQHRFPCAPGSLRLQ